jgi:imidazolonepropionase-like amidohydrolase
MIQILPPKPRLGGFFLTFAPQPDMRIGIIITGITKMLKTSLIALMASLGLALPSLAQSPTACPDGGTAIKAGQWLDVIKGKMNGPSILLICDDRITSITNGHNIPSEAKDAKIIDLSGSTLLPGLIDSHVHLTSDIAGNDAVLLSVQSRPADHAYNAYLNGLKTLRAGFTSVRNLGDDDGVVLSLRDMIAANKLMGPRIIDAGVSISTTAGHMDPTLGFSDHLHPALDVHENTCDGVESCRHAIRKQIARNVDVIKIATTGGVNSRIGSGLGQQAFDDEVKALVDTARLYKKKIAVHAHGSDGIDVALKAGVDSIEHGTMMTEEQAAMMAKSGTYYVPTLSTVNGYIERLKANPNAYEPKVKEKILWRIGVTGKSLKLATSKGVKIAFGTDAGVSKHGRNADEFELMVTHGMSPLSAIQAATVNASSLLGIDQDTGTISVGKTADLVAYSQNPLNDIQILKKPTFVMARGRVFDLTK